MSEYYSKSIDLKSKVESTSESVKINFLNKVNDYIGEVDAADQTFLETSSAYTSAKSLLEKLNDTHILNLNNMSSENGQNPMNSFIQKDKEYQTRFIAIAENKNSQEVANRVNDINSKVATSELTTYLDDLLKLGKDVLGADLYKQLTQLLKVNPEKVLEKLLENEKFIDTVSKNEKVADVFLFILGKAENMKGNWVDKLLDNKKFVNILQKNEKVADVVLKAMAKFEDGNKILESLRKLEKIASYGKVVINSKWWQVASKAVNSKIGKVVTNPWVQLGVNSAIGTFNEYTDKSSGAYHQPGKAVVGGAISGIASIGPIQGALMGAAVGGPIGAAVGGLIGATIWGAQMLFPNGVSDIKKGAYEAIDSVKEWTGKAAVNTVKSIANSSAFNTTKTAINDARKHVQEATESMRKGAENIANNIAGIKGVANWFG